jgi:RNA polymerase sigma factor (TIGR02999 family)
MPEPLAGNSERPVTGGRLLSLLYHEIRLAARRQLAGERPGHTLSPTALVNELYLRLAGVEMNFESETHFVAAASRMMRNLLVDHARARKAEKRGGQASRTPLEEITFPLADDRTIDVEALDEALGELERFGERQARVVELRFFGGLSSEEIASQLEISERTVKRDWMMARHWLQNRLES